MSQAYRQHKPDTLTWIKDRVIKEVWQAAEMPRNGDRRFAASSVYLRQRFSPDVGQVFTMRGADEVA
ncbi:hypothetical protein [Polaromonas sp.]|uniref:hypothetical protein n=1 Tax=Polaromonas sp. TaxID=1869339 RepID=UPI002FC8AA2E